MTKSATGEIRRIAAGFALAAGLAGLSLAGAAMAGDAPPAPTSVTAAAKDPDHADGDLNSAIAAANEAAAQREAASRRAFEEAQQRYLDTVNQRMNDEVRRQAEYTRQMEAWRADVAACRAGDLTRCQAEPAPPQQAGSPTDR